MLNPIFKESEIFKVEKSLISIFGLHKALFLGILHRKIQLKEEKGVEFEGTWWVAGTVKQWADLVVASQRTVIRYVNTLKKLGVISVKALDEEKMDHTNYYTINYDKLRACEKTTQTLDFLKFPVV
ncbi:MAG TPA: hypothetical protein VI959_05145 [Alphaproteobacteria bacterium]|nr:hypothetical protein [Alphaproteobacteria bacterium]